MALTGKSLDAVTTDADGVAIFFDKPLKNVSMHYSFDSLATNYTLALEGTVDGSLWVPLVTLNSGNNPPVIGFVKSTDVVVQGIRAKYDSGAPNPSLTAWVAACDL